MRKQPETRFKERIRTHLESIPNSFWFKTQQKALRGIPDFIGVVNGFYVAIELKVGNNELEPLQRWTLSQMAKAGGHTFEMNPGNLEAVLKQVQKLNGFKNPSSSISRSD